MMRKVPYNQIQNLDLVLDTIKDILPLALNRRGEWECCCPFHQELNPSFSVSEEKAAWYCFGCGEGGTLQSLLEKLGEETPPPELASLWAQLSNLNNHPDPYQEGTDHWEVRLSDWCRRNRTEENWDEIEGILEKFDLLVSCGNSRGAIELAQSKIKPEIKEEGGLR